MNKRQMVENTRRGLLRKNKQVIKEIRLMKKTRKMYKGNERGGAENRNSRIMKIKSR